MPLIPFTAILFDLDGTLVNSLAAVDRAWTTWSREYGLDPEVIVPQIHGRRAKDSIARLAPHLDQEEAFKRLEYLEATDTEGVVPLPGALEFLEQLDGIPWGIVTSGTRAIAEPRLKAGGIPYPKVFVTAEEIARGKPHPDPFLEGLKRLGTTGDETLGFEDVVAGVQSAQAAGMRVIAVSEEAAVAANFSIPDYRSLRLRYDPRALEIV